MYTLLSYIQVDNIFDVFSCETDDYVQANKLIIQKIKVYVIDPEKPTNLKKRYVLNYLQSVTCRDYTSVQASICLSICLEAF